MKTKILGLLLIILLLICGCAGGEKYKGKEMPAFNTPEWLKTAVFYEIFVRSFYDSDGNGIGDFNGMTKKLAYLRTGKNSRSSLGINAIWLMPINSSPSYHGYDVTDYKAVNPQFGKMKDFKKFLKAAHKRGIKVIMDLVMNHSSSKHPWFIDAASGANAKKRNFYLWKNSVPAGWGKPWSGRGSVWHFINGNYYYGCFWGGMPDINHNAKRVRDEFKNIMAFWLKMGIDGFRLDAVRYFIETGGGPGQKDTRQNHLLLQEYAAFMKKINPNAVFIGEAWSKLRNVAKYYGKNNELDSSFNFDMAKAIEYCVRARKGRFIPEVYEKMDRLYPGKYVDTPFIRNHDMTRIANEMKGDTAKLKKAASLLLTLPGAPFLYYGEEIGMMGKKPDRNIRRPMQWTGGKNAGFTSGKPWHKYQDDYKKINVAAQQANPGSLWNHYRKLIAFRNLNPAFARGKFKKITVKPKDETILCYTINSEKGRFLVVHNLGEKSKKVAVKIKGTFQKRWSTGSVSARSGKIMLGKDSGVVYQLK